MSYEDTEALTEVVDLLEYEGYVVDKIDHVEVENGRLQFDLEVREQ